MEDFEFGCFHFFKLPNGDLEGGYTNNTLAVILSEVAVAFDEINRGFTGTYNSTWIESNGNQASGVLTVRFIENTGNQKFRLEWVGRNNSGNFTGEGYIVDNMLIGNYTSSN